MKVANTISPRRESSWGDGQQPRVWSEISSMTPGFNSSSELFSPCGKPGDDPEGDGRSKMLRRATHFKDRPEEIGSSILVEGEVKGGEDPPCLQTCNNL